MKSFRWTLLFAVAVIALIAYSVYDYKRAGQLEVTKEKEKTIIQLPSKAWQKMELISRSGTIVLEKKGSEWFLTEPIQERADQQEVDAFILTVEGEKILEKVVDGEQVDLKPFGLDDPVTRFRVTSTDNKLQELQIGSVKAYDGNLYGKIDQRPDVYLVAVAWDSHLSKQPGDLRTKNLYHRREGEKPTTRFEIRRQDSNLEFSKEGETWRMVKPADTYPIDSELVKDAVEQVKAMRGQAYVVDDKKAAGAIAKYGLEKPALEIRLGSEDGSFEIKASKPTADNEIYAVSSHAPGILKVYPAAIEALRKSPQDYFDRKVPFKFTADEVAKVTITKSGQTAEYAKNGNDWQASKGTPAPKAGPIPLNEMISKVITGVGRFEAVRVLEPIAKGSEPTLKAATRLQFAKANGEPLFTFTWGEAETSSSSAKASEDEPEIKYVPAFTSLVNRKIAVPELTVKNLGVDELLPPPAEK